jgi:hypothetical protein
LDVYAQVWCVTAAVNPQKTQKIKKISCWHTDCNMLCSAAKKPPTMAAKWQRRHALM